MTSFISLILLIIEVCLIIYAANYAIRNKIVLSKKTFWFFVPLCVILFILYVIGLNNYNLLTNNQFNIFQIFEILKCIVRIAIFDINSKFVIDLINSNLIFKISYIVTITAIIVTIYIHLFSGAITWIVNKYRVCCRLKNECDILIGENDFNNIYLNNNRKNCIILIDSNKSNQLFEYYHQGIPILKMKFTTDSLFKTFKKYIKKSKQINFISFQDSNQNLEYINEFKNFISKKFNDKKILENKQFFLHVEIDYHNLMTIENKILEDHCFAAFINCFNRYELVSLDFIEKFPITKNLPKGFIDFSRAIINSKKIINVIYLGFGKVLKSIHRTQVMNDQLATITNNQIEKYTINYYAFDYGMKYKNDKNTIFYSERYDNNLDLYNNDEYFDAIPQLDNLNYYYEDLNSMTFFNELKNILFKNEYNNTFNRILVSFKDDIDNIDYALKITELFAEYNYNNYEIFVRIKGDIKTAQSLLNNKKIIIFGNLKNVFNHDIIVNERQLEIAKLINNEYNKFSRLCDTSWFNLSPIKQNSNIYSSLNIRLKLNLLGFDYIKEDNIVDNTEQLFELKSILSFKKNNYNDYLFFVNQNYSPINVLAYQEHLRWNAFYISYGYVPMKKSDIQLIITEENKHCFKKDSDILKEHACLTTYQGLDEYHKLLAKLLTEVNKLPFETNLNQVETYQYDYMLSESMDKVFLNTKYRLIKLN